MERWNGEAGRRLTRLGGGGAVAPVLVALAFLVVVSLDMTGPGARVGTRDTGHSRVVARPLTEALARAVRGMVGVQRIRPVAGGVLPAAARLDRRCRSVAVRAGRTSPVVHHVRAELLSLPPPARA